MFNLISDTMDSFDPSHYEDRLNFLFYEFIDLKYVIDPSHEVDVLAELIYILGARSLCRHNSYIESIWKQAYGCNVFDVKFQDGVGARNYADQIETMIKAYDMKVGAGELEMIRLVVCYAKAKGYDINKHFVTMIEKFENVTNNCKTSSELV